MRANPIIACALVLASSTAFAQVGFYSGSALLTSCEDPAHRPECTQYIAGVADAHGYDLSRFGSPRDFCTPEDITIEELERVVVKWLKDHPEKLRVTAANLVLLALSDAFKCRGDRD
ncbi:MAG TPA: Rap1a/Tai family immunity protein [Myxococcota bacterium]|nr:Rap1a/Tai family immunity protein [Myxococcota bacterium]